MNFYDHGADADDPFGSDSFAAPWAPTQTHPLPPSTPQQPTGEVNTLATLSVVFAFLFAPAGAVLGHLALAQIKRLRQRGRRRAVLGLTLSYFFIVLAVVVLIVWLLLDASKTGTPAAATMTARAPSPSISSTVITAPPQGRHRVSVEELRVGDCVEIQKNEPDKRRPNTDQIYIYRAKCEVRDGVFQITQKAANPNACSRGEFLTNDQETVVGCFVKYGAVSTPS